MTELHSNGNTPTPFTAEQWAEPMRCDVCSKIGPHSTNIGRRNVCLPCVDQLLALPARVEKLEATVRHQAAKIQSMEGQWREFHAACDWLNEAMAKSRAEERKDWGDWRGCDADWVNGL